MIVESIILAVFASNASIMETIKITSIELDKQEGVVVIAEINRLGNRKVSAKTIQGSILSFK